jgi:CDP-glycerol glycerophosphotransferase (TagB/SpsB family)
MILDFISSIIIIFLSIIFSPITKTIRRKNNIWIFGASDGNKFNEIPKHLYLYINRHHKETRVIWLSRNRTVIKELNDNGYESYLTYSLKGYYYSLIAKFVIHSDSILWDVNFIPSFGAIRINTFHGIPLKKVGEDAVNMGYAGSIKPSNMVQKLYVIIFRKAFHYIHKLSNYFIACSEEHQSKISSAFSKSRIFIPITGYPRNDAMFSSVSVWPNDNVFWDSIKKRVSFKRVIFYLPTFRDSEKGALDLFTKYGFIPDDVHRTLEKLDAVLIIKAHAHAGGKLSGLEGIVSPRIIVAPNSQLPDVYPILNKADVLITDYSSVFFDYLLLNRPIVFTPFDIDEYVTNDRALYYDYDEITPGPKAKNWPEAFKLIENVLEKDEWKSQRELVRNRFHQYLDGNSSERVFQMIQSLNESKNKKTKKQ